MKLSYRFEQALILATQLHADQVRKGGGVPYISHLLSVAALVLEDGGDEDEAIAALLHDAVEDQGGERTRELIRQKFGERVISIVDGCTECFGIPKPPWCERKLKYLENMRSASPSVLRVSMADKLHNARCTLAGLYQEGDTVWQKFTGGKNCFLWFYYRLLEIYQQNSSNFLKRELEQVIRQLEK